VGSEHGVVTFVDDTCVEHIITRKPSIPWHGLEFFGDTTKTPLIVI
jgi:hypothetical protein